MKKLILGLSSLGRWEFWRRVPLKLRVKYLAPKRPRRFPTKIQIEATSRCNLRCPSCSHSREEGKGQHLGPEEFRNILDRLPRRPKRVVLSGIGEPLLNPDFFSLVDALAERGIQCEFYSNGTLLAPPARQAILSRTNIDVVNISCDGAQAGTFESCRVGADFERWKQSVAAFLTEAKERRSRGLNVGVSIVVNKRNLGEIGDIVRLGAKLGFDAVYVLDPIPVDGVAESLCPSAAEMSAVRQGVTALAKSLGLKISCSFRRASTLPRLLPRCTQPWEYVFIRATGDVAPCCALFGSDKGAVVGNLFRQPFDDVWHGDPFREFRRASAAGTNPLCRLCPYY